MRIEVKTRSEGEFIKDGFTLTDCRGPRMHMIYQRTVGKITRRLKIAMPVHQPWAKLDQWCVTEDQFDESEE